jgi:hypothetical protein
MAGKAAEVPRAVVPGPCTGAVRGVEPIPRTLIRRADRTFSAGCFQARPAWTSLLLRLACLASVLVTATACNAVADNPDVTPTEPSPSSTTGPTVSARVATGNPPTQPVMASPDYGIQVFLYWREEVADRDLQLVQEAGFRWVKQGFAWREIEGAGKGIYDWANTDRLMNQVDAWGLNIIARVDAQPEWTGGNYPLIGPPDDYQDYVDFLTALATRYRGRIDAYQVWNEPNLSREWGGRSPNPAEYARLLRLAYQAIRAADPTAYVISAGMAPTTRWDDVAVPDTIYIQGIYDAGAAPYFDVLGVHGAGYGAAPETSPEMVAAQPKLNHNDVSPPDLRRIYCFRHIEDVRRVMVQNGDANKRIAVLEFGWTTDPRPASPYRWHAVSDEQQADYLVRAYEYARQHWQPWIAVMTLIYMPDAQWGIDDEQTYWSVIYPGYPELRLRPAYLAIKAMPKE